MIIILKVNHVTADFLYGHLPVVQRKQCNLWNTIDIYLKAVG